MDIDQLCLFGEITHNCHPNKVFPNMFGTEQIRNMFGAGLSFAHYWTSFNLQKALTFVMIPLPFQSITISHVILIPVERAARVCRTVPAGY